MQINLTPPTPASIESLIAAKAGTTGLPWTTPTYKNLNINRIYQEFFFASSDSSDLHYGFRLSFLYRMGHNYSKNITPQQLSALYAITTGATLSCTKSFLLSSPSHEQESSTKKHYFSDSICETSYFI